MHTIVSLGSLIASVYTVSVGNGTAGIFWFILASWSDISGRLTRLHNIMTDR